MTAVNALDFLLEPPAGTLPPILFLVGGDATLRCWTRRQIVGDSDLTLIDGDAALWAHVVDEQATGSLFALDVPRTVVIQSADKLISDNRDKAEALVSQPGDACRLVIEVNTLPANTKLYKRAVQHGLVVACKVPQTGSGKFSKPDLAKLIPFLSNYLAPRHQCQLGKAAAGHLIDVLGEDIGLIDNSLATIALSLPPGGKVTAARIDDVVGGWQEKTMWDIVDAAASGDAATALRFVDRLILGGQPPIALFPQLAWSLRRFAMATAAIEADEQRTGKANLAAALSRAGLGRSKYQAAAAEQQLRRIGRPRGQQLLDWLLKADLELKGRRSQTGPDRWVIEELVLKLAGAAQPR